MKASVFETLHETDKCLVMRTTVLRGPGGADLEEPRAHTFALFKDHGGNAEKVIALAMELHKSQHLARFVGLKVLRNPHSAEHFISAYRDGRLSWQPGDDKIGTAVIKRAADEVSLGDAQIEIFGNREGPFVFATKTFVDIGAANPWWEVGFGER